MRSIEETATTISATFSSVSGPEQFRFGPEQTEELNYDALAVCQYNLSVSEVFKVASEQTGNFVNIDPRFAGLPMFMGSNNKPVLLYEFVEVIQEVLDIEEVKRELPSLSYAQIVGGVSFLRRLSQFNTRGVDIDELEDEATEGSAEFQLQLKSALAQEAKHVLSAEQ